MSEQPPHDDLPNDSPDLNSYLAANEPPVDGEDTRPKVVEADDHDEIDTKPKAPPGLHEAITGTDRLHEQLAAEEPPVETAADTAEFIVSRPPARPLLLATVMLGTVCLCLVLVTLAGVAGYRDGLATHDAQITQTLATGIAEQYATGVADLHNGNYELAIARLSWIVETIQPAPEYLRDSAQLLAMASTQNAITPTATITPTLTPSPAPTDTPAPTPTGDSAVPTAAGPDPASLYNQAADAMRIPDAEHYEDALEFLEPLMQLAPDYRPQETRAMYLEALTTLGKWYLRGQNDSGEDQLARGVLLIYQASDIGSVEPASLLYEADFAERYLNARNYVNGGNYEAALPVLQTLCEENCGWAYHGVSVSDLLDRATNRN